MEAKDFEQFELFYYECGFCIICPSQSAVTPLLGPQCCEFTEHITAQLTTAESGVRICQSVSSQ